MASKPPDMSLEVWNKLLNDVDIYGNGFAEKTESGWRRIDPTKLRIMRSDQPDANYGTPLIIKALRKQCHNDSPKSSSTEE